MGCFTVLLVFVGVFQQATERGLDAVQALQLLPYVVPSMLPFTIPAAMLLTVTIVYGRLAGDLELTAAKAAGVHPFSLMWPALALGAMLSAGSLLMTDRVIPWSVQKIEAHLITVVEDIFLDQLRTELQFRDSAHNLHITVAAVDGKRLVSPVFRYVRGDRVVTLRAEEAMIRFDIQHEQAEIWGRTCLLEITEKSGSVNRTYLREYKDTIRWTRDIDKLKPRHLPVTEISTELDSIAVQQTEDEQRQAIEALMCLTSADFPRLVKTQKSRSSSLKSQKSRLFKLHTEIHSRYALACSCFFFAFVGTPFSMRFGQSQSLWNFIYCFIPIVCGYYPLMLGLMTQAKKGHIEPEWSMWIANGVLAIAALILIRRVTRY